MQTTIAWRHPLRNVMTVIRALFSVATNDRCGFLNPKRALAENVAVQFFMKWHLLRSASATLAALLILNGCRAGHPSDDQIKQVNQLVGDRTDVKWDVARLFEDHDPVPPPPSGELTLRNATERALRRNLSLVANAENLSIAHAQLVQAGLYANPVIGQSSGFLFPISPVGGIPSMDGNIQQLLNTFFTQPAKVRIARFQEVQANIDLSTQTFTLAQQVDGKYQEMIHLLRARRLAARIEGLYVRAVSAAEARQRVGVIPTPELNRAPSTTMTRGGRSST